MSSPRARLGPTEIQQLLAAPNYRVFVEVLIEMRSQRGRKFGYADIARIGGFSARSFPRSVVLGQKNLTLKSMYKFILGLGLSGELSEYFRLLVEQEHTECRTKNATDAQIRKSLSNLRKRVTQKAYASLGQAPATDAHFSAQHIPVVYAGLGSADHGASIEDIRQRTGYKPEVIAATLEKLMSGGIVEKRQSRFFAIENHLNFEGLSQSEVFKKFYIDLLEKARTNADTSFASDRNLHFCSAFSVKETDLPKMREELRALLLRYVDSAEFSEGNKVVSLACSLF